MLAKDSKKLLYNRVLELLKSKKVGLLTDVDGTLSPIALSPDLAVVSEQCRASLRQLIKTARFEIVAVISGRAALDAQKLVGLPELVYLGNHGLEVLLPDSTQPIPVEEARFYQPQIRSALELVSHKLRVLQQASPANSDIADVGLEKLFFENKGVSASIHYRLCNDREQARQVVLAQLLEIVQQAGLQVSEGRMVIELRPPVKINKGTALLNLVENYKLEGVIYLGDDLTDVDAFRAIHRLRLDTTRTTLPPYHLQIEESISPQGHKTVQREFFRGLALGVKSQEMPTLVADTADFMVEGVPGVEQFLSWLSQLS